MIKEKRLERAKSDGGHSGGEWINLFRKSCGVVRHAWNSALAHTQISDENKKLEKK